MDKQTPRPVLTERDAAPYLGLSRAWLRVARRDGYGPPYIQIGRAVRYRLTDLDAFIAGHRVEPRDERGDAA